MKVDGPLSSDVVIVCVKAVTKVFTASNNGHLICILYFNRKIGYVHKILDSMFIADLFLVV